MTALATSLPIIAAVVTVGAIAITGLLTGHDGVLATSSMTIIGGLAGYRVKAQVDKRRHK